MRLALSALSALDFLAHLARDRARNKNVPESHLEDCVRSFLAHVLHRESIWRRRSSRAMKSTGNGRRTTGPVTIAGV